MLDPAPGYPTHLRVCVIALADGRWVTPYQSGQRVFCREHRNTECVHEFVDTGPITQPKPVSHRKPKLRRATP